MRIAMYWHNGRSLGHTAESAKVASGILQTHSEAHIAGLTGAYRGLDLLPDAVDVVKLPSFANFDDPDGWRFSSRLGFTEEDFFAARADLAAVFLKHFKPEVFIVNHLPSGASNELQSALDERAYRAAVLTLRGVLFDRAKTNREYFVGDVASHIANKFSLVTVHAPREVFSLEEHYDVPNELVDRIVYTGYLTRQFPGTRDDARQKRRWQPEERVIVASMGGGQGSGPIWSSVIRALRKNSDYFDRAILVVGPYLEESALRKLHDLLQGLNTTTIVTYDADLPAAMQGADLFIGAAGSNMVGEVLGTGANSILIPRQLRESEQTIHARLLSERGLIRTSGLQQVLEGSLENLVREALSHPLHPNVPYLLGGAQRYGALIEGLIK